MSSLSSASSEAEQSRRMWMWMWMCWMCSDGKGMQTSSQEVNLRPSTCLYPASVPATQPGVGDWADVQNGTLTDVLTPRAFDVFLNK